MSAFNSFSRLFKRDTSSETSMLSSDQDINIDGSMAMDGNMGSNGRGRGDELVRQDAFNQDSVNGEPSSFDAHPDKVRLPILGLRTVAQHQRILATIFVLALALLGLVGYLAYAQANRVAQQVRAAGNALTQSQRLAKSVSQALVGSAQAFPDVKEGSEILAKSIRGLKAGDADLKVVAISDAHVIEDLDKTVPFMERAEKNAKTVMDQQKILTEVGSALRSINRQSSDLLEVAETVPVSWRLLASW
jgi:twitching motility protein PilJ